METVDYSNVVALTSDGRVRAPVEVGTGSVDPSSLYQLAVDLFTKYRPKDKTGRPVVQQRGHVPDDLFAVTGGKRRDHLDGVVKHEVRYRKIRDLESGLIRAGLRANEVLMRWSVALNEALVELQSEQPQADWKAACVVVQRGATTKLRLARDQRRVEGGGLVPPMSQLTGFAQPPDSWSPPPVVPSGTVSKLMDEDPHIEIGIVFYDAAQTELVDPNRAVSSSERDTPIAQYIESRRLDHLPVGLMMQRQDAERAWNLMVEARKREPKAVPKASAGDAEIVALLGSGIPMARIAELLGVDLEVVKAAALREADRVKSKKAGGDRG